MTEDFSKALSSTQCFLLDGSTPTVLYEKGVYINKSFDEANLTTPELVLSIHRAFRDAGAQILTTNTWAANAVKLKTYGLNEKLREINLAGAKLAREALQDPEGWVAGSMGPLGLRIEPWGPTSFEEARALFKEQAQALLEGGVDLFVLEGFADLNEIQQALTAIRELSKLPIAAMMTPNEAGQSLYGTEPEWYIRKLDEWGADLVGVNGGSGPAALLELLRRFKSVTNKPLILQPSAGLPRMVDGRLLYMASPEYLGEFARQAFQLGARAVGGCAGTTPEHIWAMRGALAQERAFVSCHTDSLPVESQAPMPPLPFEKRSRMSHRLRNGEKVVTVELVPPKGTSPEKLLEKAHQCLAWGVDTINIPDGPRAMARMSALATAVLIEREVGIETVLHYTCRDRNLLGIQADLLGASALGLHNVLAITGDPPKVGPYPHATAVYDVDAIGLVNILKRLNSGLDLGGSAIGAATSFSIGVGSNPAAVDLAREKERFRYKVEAGAEWTITQPVFDTDSFLRFLDFAQPFNLPVLAGIWPLRSLREAQFMANEVPGVYVPKAILEHMARFESAQDQLKVGLELALKLQATILDFVQGFQISAPLGQVDSLAELLKAAGCVARHKTGEFEGGA